jgi:hypothetical protein
MDVTGGNVAHIVTDDGEHVRVDRVDSVYIHPREDKGDDQNIVRGTIAGEIFNLTGVIPRTEAESKMDEILGAQSIYTQDITYNAPPGHYEIKNMYVDATTNKLVVEYDDTPVLGE